MKQYPWKFKLFWNGIEWGQSEITLDSGTYFYYFYWVSWISEPKNRMIGLDYVYYDGPHYMLCFWWFCICWSTPWSKVK